MIFYVLQTISTALITTVSTIWLVEETLINMMLSCSLMALRFVCHPLLLLPMIFATYYVIHKVWMRRRLILEGSADVAGLRNLPRTPRVGIGSYRGGGNISSRSNDSGDYEMSEEETRRRS